MNLHYWILLLIFTALIASVPAPYEHAASASDQSDHEVLYLPNGKALEALSFGYKNVLSNILWFKTISYFGAHFRSDKNYQWLYHMCNLVTDLDPRAQHVYKFCSTMLAWEIDAVDKSNAILTKAIAAFPQNWFFHYLRGFNYFYFLKDNEKAKADLLEAAKRPGVDPVIASLAAKKASELDNPEIAAMTIRGLIRMTDDPNVIQALEERLKKLNSKEVGKHE